MAQDENENLLRGINFAALVADGFYMRSLLELQYALEQAGAVLQIVSPQRGQVQGAEQGGDVKMHEVHLRLDEADPQAFAGVIITGGAQHIEKLRSVDGVRQFLQAMAHEGKPMAALGEGVALLADADVVSGFTLTGHPEAKEDIVRAGGCWADQEIVVDSFLVSGQGEQRLPDFINAILTVMSQHVQETVHGTRDEKGSIGPSS